MLNKTQLLNRKKHLWNLRKLYKGNTINKSISDWNNEFKPEYNTIKEILKGVV